MSTTVAYFRARAAECEREAAVTRLENVRERALRSAAAWQSMADRQDRTDAMRIERDEDKRQREL